MKSQINKLISIFACVCLLLTALVVPTFAADSTASYVKVTEAPADWSGDYLIVYEDGANSRVLNGSLANLDAEGNYITAAIVDNKIDATDATNAAKFTIEKNGSAYAIKSASGKYIGNSKDQNKLLTDKKYDNTLTLQTDGSVDIVSAGSHLRSNINTQNGNRFRYYKSATYTAQKAVALYKLTTVADGDEPACEHTTTSTESNGDETHKVVCGDCGETVNPTVDCVDSDTNGKCDTCDGTVAILDDGGDSESTAPVAGKAYRFGMIQENVSTTDVYYLTGALSGYYMDTTTDIAAGCDIYVEETTNGYYLYAMVDGAKLYINMVVSGTYVNGKYEATASTVYTYDEASKTMVSDVNGATYWIGTRNDKTFTTVGPVKTSYNGFYCKFYDAPTTEDDGDEPACEHTNTSTESNGDETHKVVCGDCGETVNPTVDCEDSDTNGKCDTCDGTVAIPDDGGDSESTAPVAGKAYRFGMIQENVSTTDVYYLNGALNGYYMDTTTDIAAGCDIYVEETTGGYYLYAMVDGAKLYINMVVSGTYVNGKYEAAASTVYTYDEASKTMVSDVNGATYWIGTRNDKTFTTVGPVKTSYNGFYCKFYDAPATEGGDEGGEVTPPAGGDEGGEVTPPAGGDEGGEVTPPAGGDEGGEVTPPVNNDPEADTELTITEAIELGLSKEHNTYTEGKYYVTGVIASVYNKDYGNMYIEDEDGNLLTIYGTYDATGEIGYAEMETKPVAGDTVTIYGKIGQYSNAAQIKNGWIVDHIPGEGEPESNDPAADSVLTIEEAIALGESKLHNVFTENKYYVTGVITEIYDEMYGNMRITDAEGNILTLYGTSDEDGNRFDAMEVKPEVGDTITVYGIIGQYNGTPQMKNGVFTTAPAGDEGEDDGEDDTTGGTTDDNTTGGTTDDTTGTGTGSGTTTDTTSPVTGDTVGSCVAMAIAAAAVVLYTSKKRS